MYEYKELSRFLLGQEEPLEKVCDYLDMIENGVVDPEKPKASLLLCGPSGTGKTATAKIVAKYFTGSDKNMYIVSGPTMQSDTAVSTLFGSDAGYVGYKDTSDFLAFVKQHPNCVLLFDEIEKASPAVFKALLEIIDEGKTRDKAGNTISFSNYLVYNQLRLWYKQPYR